MAGVYSQIVRLCLFLGSVVSVQAMDKALRPWCVEDDSNQREERQLDLVGSDIGGAANLDNQMRKIWVQQEE